MDYDSELGRRFWHDLDSKTLYNAPFFNSAIGPAGAIRIQDVYATTRRDGTYPNKFRDFIATKIDKWKAIADVQTSTIADVLGNDWDLMQRAIEDFGQGILVDSDPARVNKNDVIHMMDGQKSEDVVGYHRWHASIRAIQLLGIGDPLWWENLDRIVAFGWGIQSYAQPLQQPQPNARLSEATLEQLRAAWLHLSPAQRDRQYDSTPQAVGYHPSPMQPVA